jgi:hypothetical protein
MRSALLSPRAPQTVVAVTLVLASTSIGVGFTADDYGFLRALETGLRRSFDLFSFASGDAGENLRLADAGVYPWWIAPDCKEHFLRVLSSLLFTLEHAVFGDRPLGFHLTSLALYGALLVAVHQILRRVLPRPTATLALLLFGLRAPHALPYAWLCAQHMLVGALPATLGLLAYVCAEEADWKPGRLAGPALFLLGVAGSEAALAIVPLWIAYAVARGCATGHWAARVRGCVAVSIFAALYLASYHLVGGGTHHALDYVDPVGEPLAFARAVATRVPMLLGDALLAFPANPRSMPLLHAGVGLGGVALFAALFLTSRAVLPQERAALAWLVPGALGATLLGGASGAARLLLIPDIGFCALVAVLLRDAVARARDRSTSTGRRLAGATAVACLLLAHLVLAPVRSLSQIRALASGAREDEEIAATAELRPEPGQHVLVVASPDPGMFFFPKEVLGVRSPGLVRCWSGISAAAGRQRIARTGPRSFDVEPLEDAGDGYDALYVSSRAFAAGDAVRQCGMTVRVAAVERGRPSRLSVELDESLDSSDLTFLGWKDDRLRRLALPPVGEALEVPGAPASGPDRLTRLLARFTSVWR